MKNKPNELKKILANEMAEIDCENNIDNSSCFDYHYNKLLNYSDFNLLYYWIEYFGVFDGGEKLLNKLKINN